MREMVQQRKRAFFYLAYTAVFGAALVFLFWKCRYGYAHTDEAFYLTIPYRLCLGDGLLLHEWHLSQLSGFLLYPVMWLYRLLFPDMTGILYHFRLLFTLVWGLSALFLFLRLRRALADALGRGAAAALTTTPAPDDSLPLWGLNRCS